MMQSVNGWNVVGLNCKPLEGKHFNLEIATWTAL